LYFSGDLKYYTLLDISQSIESVISKAYTGKYWVKAEISKLNYYPKSGHCYPDLVEKRDERIVVQMRSTIWRQTFERLSSGFLEATGEKLRGGIEVLLRVQVVYDSRYGFSLNITDLDPTFTLGKLAQEKTASIARLKKERIFDKNKQILFPVLPLRLAVISVETSKGYHDFISTLNDKLLNFRISVKLFPALLQGDESVTSISEQLELIKKQKNDFDLAFIIRGGGGEIGLQAYNNFDLAYRVATFPLPIITGIGHASNETVVGMVANLNMITPTEAANFLVEKIYSLAENLKMLGSAIRDKSILFMKESKTRLAWNIELMSRESKSPLAKHSTILNGLANQMQGAIKIRLNLADSFLKSLFPLLKKQTGWHLQHKWQRLESFGSKLRVSGTHLLLIKSRKLELEEARIKLLDPKKVLQRGYSLTLKNGKALTSILQLNKDDVIETLLSDGKLKSTIKEIIKDEK